MAIPKMTLRVELIGTTGAEIKLINVSNIYTRSGTLISGGKSIQTDNGWIFFIGNEFKINKAPKIITIPQSPNKHKDTLSFQNDKDRKEVLKEFHTALLQWSGNKIFKDKIVFDKTPNIKFFKDVWIIF